MSHSIPSYYRYVSSITVVDPGTGYDSNNPPRITISGGGGTGATAEATIRNSEIVSVRITNIGSGYTSTPIVTVEGSAVLTASISYAAGPTTEHFEVSHIFQKYNLPEFIREEYTKFVSFIDKYYEYMDQEGNPINILLNGHYNDIDHEDHLPGNVLQKWRNQLARNFSTDVLVDRKFLYKHIKDVYETKGSERSIRAFFRIFYNEEVDIVYPNILKASDGVWIQEKTVRVYAANDYEVLDLYGTEIDFHYWESIGSSTVLKTIPANVTRVAKISYTNPQVYEVIVDFGNTRATLPGPGSSARATATVTAGEITALTFDDTGSEYLAKPTVEIYDTAGGSGAQINVSVSEGSIDGYSIIDGGQDYVDGSTINIVFNTDNVRTFITDRNASPTNMDNVRAYVARELLSLGNSTYTGVDAGFKKDEIYLINELGDDRLVYAELWDGEGDVSASSAYFAEDYVVKGGGLNNAYAKVVTLNDDNSPKTWAVVDPGSQFNNATTEISLTSSTGEIVTLPITTGYLYQYSGYWLDDRGKLSDVNRIQDNQRYQKFSYIIRSSNPQELWDDKLRDTVHPAGWQAYGELSIRNNMDFSNYAIIVPGYDFKQYYVDETVDVGSVVTVNFFKVITDPITITDADAKDFEKVLTNSFVADDSGGQTYFAQDYIDNDYYVREGGITKHVFKTVGSTGAQTYFAQDYVDNDFYVREGIGDLHFAYDSVSIVATWNRDIDDTINTSEQFVALIDIIRNFSETLSSSDIVDEIVVNKTISDSNSHIDSDISFEIEAALRCEISAAAVDTNSINIDKIESDNVSNTESVEKSLTRTRSDTATPSDSGVLTIQDYADPTYFAEDFVGEGRSL